MAEENINAKTALVLSGGGARAAYQVGVLMAIADIVPNDAHNPFGIICGVSAGAVNAATLATHASHFRTGVRGLSRIWGNMQTHQVYKTDMSSLLKSLFALLISGFRSGELNKPIALLDNTPMSQLISMLIDVRRIKRGISQKDLRALAITASCYGRGESVTFFQGAEDIEEWQRSHRRGKKADITHSHLMGSSAIPLIFPAANINGEYYGDGAIRLLAPVSPALHMGAEKVLVIGVSGTESETDEDKAERIQSSYPSVAQVIGHVWNASFVDTLEADVERIKRLNKSLELIPDKQLVRHKIHFKEIDLLKIYPSRRLDDIAAEHVASLPWQIRLGVKAIGATSSRGAGLLSYLLFEGEYCHALMALGHHDAMNRKEEIQQFLGVPDKHEAPKRWQVFSRFGRTERTT